MKLTPIGSINETDITANKIEAPTSEAPKPLKLTPVGTLDEVNAVAGAPSANETAWYKRADVEQAVLASGDLDLAMRASQGNLEWALQLTKGIKPETAARIRALSAKTGYPEDTVRRNMGEVEDRAEALEVIKTLTEKDDKGGFKYPYTLAWLGDPEKMKLAKDDYKAIPQLEAIMRKTQQENENALDKVNRAFKTGLASLYSSVAKMPALAYDLFAYPQNKIAQVLDIPSLKVQSPEILRNNAVTQYYDKIAEFHKPLEMDENSIAQLTSGDYAGAAQNVALQAVSNAPQLLAMALGGAVGVSAKATLGTMGAMEASSAAAEGAARGKDPAANTEAAVLRGVAEGFFEKYTLDWMSALYKNASKEVGKEGAKAFIGETAKMVLANSVQEGQSELATSLAQDLADYITGDKVELGDAGARAANAFLVGAFTGGSVTATTRTLDLTLRATLSNKEAESFAKAEAVAAESKLRERSPEAFKDFLDNAIPEAAKSVFVSPDAIAALYQKDPEGAKSFVEELGLNKEIAEAKETGRDVEINKADLLTKFANSEVLKSLKPELRFGKDGMTELERNELQKELEETIAETKAQLAEIDTDQDIPEAIKKIRTQMIETQGLKAEDADAQLAVFLAGLKHFAKVRGETLEQTVARINPSLQFGGEFNRNAFMQDRRQVAAMYSKLTNTIESKMQKAASVGQVKGLLKEIKAEEMEYSGLNAFLEGKEKVTKQEILDHLAENQIEIEDVTLGYQSTDKQALDDFNAEMKTKYGLDFYGKATDEEIQEYNALAEKASNTQPLPTKFENYTLPGGENYREVLFTLPSKEAQTRYKIVKNQEETDYQNDGTDWVDVVDTQQTRTLYTGQMQDAQEYIRQELKSERSDKDAFTSSHYDEKNILAHVRLKDRVTEDGKKTLFVEEIQSDWHQAGRDKGYKTKNLQIRNFDAFVRAQEPNATNEQIANEFREAKSERYKAWQKELEAASSNANKVPDAPFKKTWHEYAFKRILRMAAEGGYDSVTWTTGEQQAERYDLSKQIDDIRVIKFDDVYAVSGNKNGENLFMKRSSENELSNLVGKDLSQKIIADASTKKDGEVLIYTGVDLKVGGEGMKGFYDKMLVDFANKYTKKWGGKVADAQIETDETVSVHSLELTPQMKDAVLFEGQTLFQSAFHGTPHDFDKFTLQKIGSGEGAQAYGWGLYFASSKNVAEWYRSKLSRPVLKIKGFDEKQIEDIEFFMPLKSFVYNMIQGEWSEAQFKEQLAAKFKDNDAYYAQADERYAELDKALVKLFKGSNTKEQLVMQQQANEKRKASFKKKYNDFLKIRDALLGLEKKDFVMKQGQLYEVEIPEAEDMLDWDKPFSEQSEKVKEALSQTHETLLASANKSTFDNTQTKELTGEEIYLALETQAALTASKVSDIEVPYTDSTQKSASKYLLSKGIPGLKYLDGSSRKKGEGNYNFVIFDDSLVEIKNKFYQDQQSPKGAVQFANGQTLITLFKSADFSTFLHETGHIFMNEMESLINEGKADEQTKADYQTLLGFAGGKLDREGQEKIARGFEAYLREGNAPSAKLVSAFRKFKAWLTSIYRSMVSLDVEINDDIRGVFSRMLQAEADIAETEHYYKTRKTIEDLLDAEEKLKNEIKAKRALGKIKARESQMQRYLDTYLKLIGGKKAISNLAEAEINEQPVYKTIDAIKALGAIDAKDVEDLLGKEYAKKLTAIKLAKKNGKLPLAKVAADFGFNSREELIETLVNTPPKAEAVEQRTKEILAERESQILQHLQESEKIPGEDAIHNESTLDTLVLEAEALTSELNKKRKQKIRSVELKAIQDAAKEALYKKTPKEAGRYDLFAKAEQRFANQAYEFAKKGELEKALEAKRKQIINHVMVQEAVKLKEEKIKIENFYKTKAITAKLGKMENNYANLATDLINHFGLNSLEGTGKVDYEGLDKVMASMIPSWVFKKEFPNGGTTYKDLSFGQLKELHDAIKTIIHYGRNELSTMDEERLKNIEDFVDVSVSNMNELKDNAIYDEFSVKGKLMNTLDGLLSEIKQMEFIFERLDNYSFTKTKTFGALRKLFNKGVDAETKFNELKGNVMTVAKPHLKTLYKAKQRLEKLYGKKFQIPGVPIIEDMQKLGRFHWTAERVIALSLNMGNEGNIQALMNGYGYDMDQLKTVMGLLTDAELQAIQGIWDATNLLYPELNEVHFKIYNRYLPKVEGNEITLGNSMKGTTTLKGGYYPLHFDHAMNDQAARYAENKEAEDLMKNRQTAIFRSTKPEDGMTYSRTPGHSLPPELALGVWFSHIADTARYISHAEYMRDLNKVTSHPRWREAFRAKAGRAMYNEVRRWVSFQALPERRVLSGWEKLIDHQTRMASIAMLGLNIISGLKQRIALLPGGDKIGWDYVLKAAMQSDMKTSLLGLESGEQWQKILKLSPYMKTRAGAIDRELKDAKDRLSPNVARFEIAGRNFSWKDVQDFAYEWMTMNDRATVGIIWLGAFNKAMGENNNLSEKEKTAKAVAYADAIIRETQAAALPIDTNTLMRKEGMMRLFTLFMTESFRYGNRLMGRYKAWREGAIDNRAYFRHVLHEVFGAAYAQLIFASVLVGGEAPEWEEWITSPITNLVSWIPILRELPGAAKYNRAIGESPAFEGVKRITKATKSIEASINDEKEWQKTLWDIGKAVEFQLGVPALKLYQDAERTYNNIMGESPRK